MKRRALELAELALDLPPDRCAALLEEHCRGDLVLRREVESLLAQRTDEFDWLHTGAGLEAISWTLLAGDRVGAFEVIRSLGSGGMGQVYLARRVEGEFIEEVAIKVLKAGDSREWRRRFVTERQVLANLRHPNIASILDGGTTVSGLPYFVMEAIKGVPLDVYASCEDLSVQEVLEVFLGVCRAVSFAHQNLVVHRDLKPGNILVTADGVPKLLDFGIAKLLDDAVGSETSTCPWNARLTPAYASPEQWLGEPISTASDAYSLGVILHELLLGRRPFEVATDLSFADLRRAVSMRKPPPMRARERRAEDAVACHRFDALSPDLRLDLEKVTHKALATVREDRYRSAAALAAEIERFLDGRPVEARRPSNLDLTRKWLRRNRPAAAATTAILLSILLSILTLVAGRRTAVEERDRAQKTVSLLVDIFETSDPYENLGERITAKQAFDSAVARVRADPNLVPDLRADLLGAIGRIQLNLGEFDAAGELLEETRALRLRGDAKELAATHHSLGQLALVRKDYAAAERWFRLALDDTQGGGDGARLRRSEILLDLGLSFQRAGEHERAERVYADATVALEPLPVGGEALLARSWRDLGRLRLELGDYPAATEFQRRSVALLRRIFGNIHPEVAEALSELGLALHEQGHWEDAIAAHREALETKRQIFGEEHLAVAHTLHDLALTLDHSSLFGEAEAALKHALELEVALLGEDHLDVATTSVALGVLYRRMARLDEADAALSRALEITERQLGADSLKMSKILPYLALVREKQGRYPEALDFYRRTLDIQLGELPLLHPRIATTYSNLAGLYVTLGRLDEAEAAYGAALERLRVAKGEEHHDSLAVLNNLAGVRMRQGATSDAYDLASEVLEIRKRVLPKDHLDIANSLNSVASLLLELDQPTEALPLLEESLAIAIARLGTEHTAVSVILNNKGRALWHAGRLDEAESVLRRSLALREAVLGPVHPQLRSVLESLANLMAERDQDHKSAEFRARIEALPNHVDP